MEEKREESGVYVSESLTFLLKSGTHFELVTLNLEVVTLSHGMWYAKPRSVCNKKSFPF